MIKEFKKDKLDIRIYETRAEMGAAAAAACAETMRRLLKEKKEINMIFAAAPSQNEFLENLVKAEGIDWSRVNGFHMDEYIGLPKGCPQSFGQFLKEAIFDRVPFGSVTYVDITAKDAAAECERYSEILRKNPTDIVCMGIGENGHIAFNDPHVADFNDPKLAKVVDLDDRCRQQQVHDGSFKRVEDIPPYAISLTIPALTTPPYVFCMVPGSTKTWAVTHTVRDEITEACPATILRKHPCAVLYADRDSAADIL